MPILQIENPIPFDTIPNRIRWSIQQCDALRDAGFLTGRYELIDGEIISKMGQKPAHARRVNLIMAWLVSVFGSRYVRIQSTIDIADTDAAYDESEPDAVVTLNPESAYEIRHPTPPDIRLVIEVSDTTERFDRTTKAKLYAHAGVREYWVADVSGRRVYVHRTPTSEGYADVKAYGADEKLAPLACPDAFVTVGTLLPPTS